MKDSGKQILCEITTHAIIYDMCFNERHGIGTACCVWIGRKESEVVCHGLEMLRLLPVICSNLNSMVAETRFVQ